MKVNKSDDALVCFNLPSLFEEVFFVFVSVFVFFPRKHPIFTNLWANGSQLMLTYVNTIVKVTETIMCAHGNSNPSVSSYIYIFNSYIIIIIIIYFGGRLVYHKAAKLLKSDNWKSNYYFMK